MGIENYHCLTLNDISPDLGQIVRCPAGQPTFQSDILSCWDGIATWEISGKTGIGWFELRKRPFIGNEAERHRLTPEALLCIKGTAVCVIGRPKDQGVLIPADFQGLFLEPDRGSFFTLEYGIPYPSRLRKKRFSGPFSVRGQRKMIWKKLTWKRKEGFSSRLPLPK